METLLMVVTLVSLALAVVMAVVGWRLLSGDRRRSAARVEALELEAQSPDQPGWDSAGLFGADPDVAATAPPSRRWVAVAAVAVLMIGGAGTVFALYRSPESGGATGTQSVGSRSAKPLELVSLRHGADPDGSFSVTGLVQNPSDGRPLTGVVAVIYLFDRDGNYFASGRSSLEDSSLQPGDESAFVVHVPAVSGVARYRVTFRKDDGAVMPHVDRRRTDASARSESSGVGQ